jgi:N-acetylglucosamine transport system substrate-binding protein
MNKALFIPNGTWMEDEMANADRASGYRFSLTPPPVLNPDDTRYVTAYVEQFSIPANAPNAENAKLFLRFLYTDEMIKLYAQSGAVMATANALELVKDIVSDGVYGMFAAFNEPGAAPLVFSTPTPPRGSSVIIDPFGLMSEVMSGRMTALEWGEAMDKAYRDIAAGL